MGETIQPMRRTASEPAVPGAASIDDQLAAFFDEHYERIVRLAGLVCRSGVLAEDAVQAAMEQAWRRRSSPRDPARMRWWLDALTPEQRAACVLHLHPGPCAVAPSVGGGA